MISTVFRVLALATLLGLVGCQSGGPASYLVEGKVYYRNKPLSFGTIMVAPAGARPAIAQIQPDGSFSLQVAAGTHPIGVEAVPERKSRPNPDVEGGIEYLGPPVRPLVPEQFNRPSESGLTIKVEPRENRGLEIRIPPN